MKSFKIIMKSVCIMSVLLLMSAIELSAQDSNLEIKIESAAVSNDGASDGKIIVTATSDKPNFVYRLFDNAPWDNGNVLAISEPTNESKYIFENLKPAKYTVCVTDDAKVTRCEYVTVREE